MRRLAASFGSAYAAALCALALLSFAQVRSNTMQAAELAPGSTCLMPMAGMGAMPGMPGMRGGAGGAAHEAPGKAHAACDFCSAAAHAPLLAGAVRVALPEGVVWSPAPLPHSLGARGPPDVQPRARGPPAPPLTA